MVVFTGFHCTHTPNLNKEEVFFKQSFLFFSGFYISSFSIWGDFPPLRGPRANSTVLNPESISILGATMTYSEMKQ